MGETEARRQAYRQRSQARREDWTWKDGVEIADLREVETLIEGISDANYPSQAKFESYEGEKLLVAGFKPDLGRKRGVLVSKKDWDRLRSRACWLNNDRGESSAWWMLEDMRHFELPWFKKKGRDRDYEAEGLVDLRYMTSGTVYQFGRDYVFNYEGTEYEGDKIGFGWDFDGFWHGFPFQDAEVEGSAGRFDEKKAQEFVLGIGNWVIGYMFKFGRSNRS